MDVIRFIDSRKFGLAPNSKIDGETMAKFSVVRFPVETMESSAAPVTKKTMHRVDLGRMSLKMSLIPI